MEKSFRYRLISESNSSKSSISEKKKLLVLSTVAPSVSIACLLYTSIWDKPEAIIGFVVVFVVTLLVTLVIYRRTHEEVADVL